MKVPNTQTLILVSHFLLPSVFNCILLGQRGEISISILFQMFHVGEKHPYQRSIYLGGWWTKHFLQSSFIVAQNENCRQLSCSQRLFFGIGSVALETLNRKQLERRLSVIIKAVWLVLDSSGAKLWHTIHQEANALPLFGSSSWDLYSFILNTSVKKNTVNRANKVILVCIIWLPLLIFSHKVLHLQKQIWL